MGTAFSKNHNFAIDGWISLETYSLGIVEGIIFAEQGAQGMDVTLADDYESLFNLLEQDQIDVAVAPSINGQVLLQQREATAIKEMEGILEILFLYHYVHRANEHLVPRLEGELKAMLLDGTILEIRDRVYQKLFAEE